MENTIECPHCNEELPKPDRMAKRERFKKCSGCGEYFRLKKEGNSIKVSQAEVKHG